MFTLTDFEKARIAVNDSRNGKVYTPQKNQLSFELAHIQSPHDRGTIVEIMVASRLQLSGVDCKQVGGKGQPDIEVYANGRLIRAEVKSSTLGPKSRRYEFTGVDPETLDILFLAFIHPERGLVVRTVSKPHLMRWVQTGGKGGQPAVWSTAKDGYTIGFDENMINPAGIITTEWNGGAWS